MNATRPIRILFTALIACAATSLSPLLAGNALKFLDAKIDGVDGDTALEEVTSARFSPDGLFVYAVSATESAITGYSRDVSTGALTRVQIVKNGEGAFTTLPDYIKQIAISPDGKNVYASAGDQNNAVGDDSLIVFSRDTMTGVLTELETHVNGMGGVTGMGHPRSIVVSPDGAHVYVGSIDDSTLALFSRNSMTGSLTFLSNQNPMGELTGNGPRGLKFSSDGVYLYVALLKDKSLVVLQRNSGTGILSHVQTIADITDVPAGTISQPRELALSPDENFLYVADGSGYNVPAFARNPTTGVLTFASNVTIPGTDLGVLDLAVSPDGTILVATIYNESIANETDVTVYARNQTSGSLKLLQSLKGKSGLPPFAEGAVGVAISPDGNHTIVTSYDESAVISFGFRPNTDLRIGTKSAVASHRGNDIYSASGAGQQIKIKKKGRAKFYTSVENDGAVPDAIRLKVKGLSTKKFDVKVFKLTGGRKNVTAKILKRGFTTTYSAGQVHNYQVQVRGKGSAFRAKTRILGIGASSRDTTKAKLQF